MGIKLHSTQKIEPNMSSMSDLVFLLLIFFMITSTLVSPNVISLSLPASNSGKQNTPKNIEVYVDSLKNYYVNPEGKGNDFVTAVADSLLPALRLAAENDQSEQHSIILRADKSVPIENVVSLMDVINVLNAELEAQEKERYKVALATEGKD
ncbi:MAG: biopolymer transporter ExbD [Bacteroidales bacterium]|jgi:biopolymer transport protein ExbD|nr:biopolymer transporter ExbD [Bacteroidales bacterium]